MLPAALAFALTLAACGASPAPSPKAAPVGEPAHSDDECDRVVENTLKLMGPSDVSTEEDIAECRAHNTPAQNACILAAATQDALAKCFSE